MINCFVIVRVKRGSIHLTLNYAELLQKIGGNEGKKHGLRKYLEI